MNKCLFDNYETKSSDGGGAGDDMDDNRKQIADLTGLADVADSGTYAYRALTNAFYFS